MKQISECRQDISHPFSFATRMTGTGKLAETLRLKFHTLFQRLDFKVISPDDLDKHQYTRQLGSAQRELF